MQPSHELNEFFYQQGNRGEDFAPVKCIHPPAAQAGGGSVVDSLFTVHPVVC